MWAFEIALKMLKVRSWHQARASTFIDQKLVSSKIVAHVSFAVKSVFLKDLELALT